MKINGNNVNFFKDILKPAIKDMFNFRHIKLERSPDTDTFQVNVFHNTPGIKSETFQTLLSDEFTPKSNLANNGLKITTLIDKKSKKPVEAFVAGVESEYPNCEKYIIMVKDEKGKIKVQNEKYKIIGETHFYIDKKRKMISPRYEISMIDGELHEKVHSYMKSKEKHKYAGIGTRLHQIRVERMLQNNFGNVEIVAEGNSFPFHYSMGYRLRPIYKPVDDAAQIMHELSEFNKQPARENAKYLAIEVKDKKQIINLSATIENCLNDYYKNKQNPALEFTPNMFLDETSVNQWIEMIQKQPILY